ncbi:hypothetical protein GCM10010399_09280 [Dactylosporangium fulvum]|uniref:Uncharacterized protein n=1 Tax=Dactylosporangium fulvum TaxID=53359 RepID=A0ABY5WB63_9ACTN|nr:hypothetical protein [Dactylosporangium fulvum]UWP86757.1 hypothetical protein Dfulv_21945 [Dactylosporangium fulvum]
MNDQATASVHDVDLVLEPRLHVPGAPPRISGRVSLGTPVVRPLTADLATTDPDWRAFLEAEAAHSAYFVLSLFCTFRAAPDGDPIADAAVGVKLHAPDAPADRQPIAWSIDPKRRVRPVPRTGRISLTAKLTIVESTVEYAPEGSREELFVVGMGEHDSDPEWRFRAVSGSPLIGDEELTVVVKAPAGILARADVSVAATVKHRRLGLIPYRADLPPVLRTVELPAQDG